MTIENIVNDMVLLRARQKALKEKLIQLKKKPYPNEEEIAQQDKMHGD